MWCIKCGKEIENDSAFCPYCGARTDYAKENADSNNNMIQTDTIKQEPVYHYEPVEPKGGKNTLKAIKVAILIFVILVLSVWIYIACGIIKTNNMRKRYYGNSSDNKITTMVQTKAPEEDFLKNIIRSEKGA